MWQSQCLGFKERNDGVLTPVQRSELHGWQIYLSINGLCYWYIPHKYWSLTLISLLWISVCVKVWSAQHTWYQAILGQDNLQFVSNLAFNWQDLTLCHFMYGDWSDKPQTRYMYLWYMYLVFKSVLFYPFKHSFLDKFTDLTFPCYHQ